MNIKERLYAVYSFFTNPIGRFTKSYYFEDYRRVYPDNIAYYPFGIRRKVTKKISNNFKNHQKFYGFASQFVAEKRVVDVGCGSGHGAEVLKKNGAADVYGCDVSKPSVKFAQTRFGNFAHFSCQPMTDMNQYPDDFADVVVSSEVLEHVKEYGKEGLAIQELKRITRKGGLLIIATPNSELLGGHGFSFDEISKLFAGQFSTFCIFENAFVPSGDAKAAWETRSAQQRTGVIVSELINFDESVLPKGSLPEIKKGLPPGKFKFDELEVDTALLHNTHSWIVLAVNKN